MAYRAGRFAVSPPQAWRSTIEMLRKPAIWCCARSSADNLAVTTRQRARLHCGIRRRRDRPACLFGRQHCVVTTAVFRPTLSTRIYASPVALPSNRPCAGLTPAPASSSVSFDMVLTSVACRLTARCLSPVKNHGVHAPPRAARRCNRVSRRLTGCLPSASPSGSFAENAAFGGEYTSAISISRCNMWHAVVGARC